MKVVYHGHACFEIKGEDSPKSIIFDPYGSGTGDLKLDVKSDLALCTHDHFDHNNCSVAGDCLKSFVGEKQVGGALIRGIRAYHDDAGGSQRGEISMYALKYGGKIFVHVGDLGHKLDDNLVREILVYGRPDVLFIPVGGVYTIGPKEALDVIEKLNPRVVVPMHYKHPKLNPRIFGKLHTLDDFLSIWKGKKIEIDSNEWEIPDELPEETTLLVLKFP